LHLEKEGADSRCYTSPEKVLLRKATVTLRPQQTRQFSSFSFFHHQPATFTISQPSLILSRSLTHRDVNNFNQQKQVSFTINSSGFCTSRHFIDNFTPQSTQCLGTRVPMITGTAEAASLASRLKKASKPITLAALLQMLAPASVTATPMALEVEIASVTMAAMETTVPAACELSNHSTTRSFHQTFSMLTFDVTSF
jgi:hypothetical protein